MRGWLGLSVQEFEEDAGRAVVVVDVYPDSPALKAGIQVGDRVSKVGGRPVQRYQQILRRVALLAPGTTVKIELERGGKHHAVSAVLVERPASQTARAMATGKLDRLGLVLKGQGGSEPGLRIEAIVPSSPADTAGLAVGDVLIEVQREPVLSLADVERALSQLRPGEGLLVRVRRATSLRYFTLSIGP